MTIKFNDFINNVIRYTFVISFRFIDKMLNLCLCEMFVSVFYALYFFCYLYSKFFIYIFTSSWILKMLFCSSRCFNLF